MGAGRGLQSATRLFPPSLVVLQLQYKWEWSRFPFQTNNIKHVQLIFHPYLDSKYFDILSLHMNARLPLLSLFCSGGAGVTLVLITASRFVGLNFSTRSVKVSQSLDILENMSCVPATFLHDNVSCYFENVHRFSKAPPALQCKSPTWTSCFPFEVMTVWTNMLYNAGQR